MGETRKITDAQLGVLWQIAEHGPLAAIEVMGPPKIDGSRKIKIECHALNAATLDSLCRNGLVTVERGSTSRPANAVGKLGHARTPITVLLTDAGRAAIDRPTPVTTEGGGENG